MVFYSLASPLKRIKGAGGGGGGGGGGGWHISIGSLLSILHRIIILAFQTTIIISTGLCLANYL